jgi:ABC-type amino acid transport substrate-binding protein
MVPVSELLDIYDCIKSLCEKKAVGVRKCFASGSLSCKIMIMIPNRNFLSQSLLWSLACLLLCLVPAVVSATTVLRTGFQDSAPKYILQNGVLQGVCFDIITELNERLQGKVHISYPLSGDPFLPWKRTQNYLQSGELDIVVGMAQNSRREKLYSFSKEPLYTIHSVFARRTGEDSQVYHSFADLGNKQVVAVAGTKTARLLAKNHPETILTHTATAALRMLLVERGDLVFYHDLGLCYIIKKNGWQEKIVFGASQDTYQHFIGYNQSIPLAIRDLIDGEIRAMKRDGTMAAILGRYR